MTESPPARLLSLDQFRGFTVAAMFLVNFAGGFQATPDILRHHNTWCSFADTVMPQFFFAVGMALRLVMLRDAERHSPSAALKRGAARGASLMLLGLFWYQPRGGFDSWHQLTTTAWGDVLRNVFLTSAFQALTHIGAATLWVLPVILCSARALLLFTAASAGLHVILSHWFWYDTLHQWHVIDGGPLGFLTWTLPVVAGALTCDAVHAASGCTLRRLFQASAATMLAGYGLACLTQGGVPAAPPFFKAWHPPDLWTMSQRAGSVSYLLFSAGFSLAVYAAFYWWSDRQGRSLKLLSDLGQNALAAYLIHMIVLTFMEHLAPRDSPLWWALLLTTAGFLISWRATVWLNRRRLFLRL